MTLNDEVSIMQNTMKQNKLIVLTEIKQNVSQGRNIITPNNMHFKSLNYIRTFVNK